MNKFLKDQKLIDDIAEAIYQSKGSQGWQFARRILKIVNESHTGQIINKMLFRICFKHDIDNNCVIFSDISCNKKACIIKFPKNRRVKKRKAN